MSRGYTVLVPPVAAAGKVPPLLYTLQSNCDKPER
ncbi:hypothetical protein T4D_5609 [Trichinella pseudospiralis]|uniref:Uncharacterized protein n=1 Tax=Trichinella pseudospiralis TaxID=6337 RepID=A0A0V1F4K8_TRIPS|nr:hypothetical protein T4D_10948 [Trichinella pseudospiralis]KRY82837.1 hypothetical protein T4D_5609 [Trichinella pseudospiralis]